MFAFNKALAIFLSAILTMSSFAFADTKQDSSLLRISVVAIADDVLAVVLCDEQGNLRRYAIGTAVADSGWHVARVAHGKVTFEFSQRIHGDVVALQLGAGDSADLGISAATAASMQRTQAVPVSTNLRALKRKSGLDH